VSKIEYYIIKGCPENMYTFLLQVIYIVNVYKFSGPHFNFNVSRKNTYLNFSLLCDSVFIIPAFNIDPKSTLRIGQIIVGIDVQRRNGLGAWREAEPLHDCHHCHLGF